MAELPRLFGQSCRARVQALATPLLLGALSVAAVSRPAVAEESERSLQLSAPVIGIHFLPVAVGGQDPQVTTFTAVAGPNTRGGRRCLPITDWRPLAIKPEGHIRLFLSVPADLERTYRDWLQTIAGTDSATSHADLLRRSTSGIEAGLVALAGSKWKDVITEFVIRVTPDDCIYEETVPHDLKSAGSRLTVPIALHHPALLEARAVPWSLWAIVDAVAHEAVHVQQMHPFDSASLVRHRKGGLWYSSRSHVALSFDFEARAMTVEHCLRQAVLPNDWNGERLALTWRDRRSAFWEVMRGEPMARVRSAVFGHQFRAAGPAFVNAMDDATLTSLFEHCAMHVQRDGVIHRRDRPLAQERWAGRAALAAIRESTVPVRFKGLIYESLALP